MLKVFICVGVVGRKVNKTAKMHVSRCVSCVKFETHRATPKI